MENRYLKIIEQIREQLVDFYQMSAEIIALAGSRALDLDCENSDYDFYVVYSGNQMYDKKRYTLEINDFKVDIRCCSLQSIVESDERYYSVEVRYPSVLYRTLDEKKRNDIVESSVEWEDFYRGMLYKTLLNDNAWMRRRRQEYCSLTKNILAPKAVADYYFTRAHENFYKFIKDHEEILVRKYLYTLHEILYCEWLLSKKEYPPFEFLKLVSMVDEKSTLEEVYKLYRLNKVKCKENNWILKSACLNKYIDKKLVLIANILDADK